MRRGGAGKSNLTAPSAATLVYVFLVEGVCWGVLLEMTGKELLSSLVYGAGHGAQKNGVMEVSNEVSDPCTLGLPVYRELRRRRGARAQSSILWVGVHHALI